MIKSIVFRNWMCFRGEHQLAFKPHAYAVVAKYESDPGRSNWGGKSAFFEGVEFALTGRLNKDRRFDADGWITEGEKDGLIRVEFEDGSSLERTRVRGKPTQLRYFQGGTTASQDDAQSKLLKRLGFDADEYRTVAYFPQGTMARLIRTEPEKRFDIIRGWLGLAKAEQAESLASDLVKQRVREVQKLKDRLKMLTEQRAEMALVSEEEIKALMKERTDLKKKLDVLHQERDVGVERAKLAYAVEVFDSKIAQGKRLTKEIESEEFPSDLETLMKSIEEEYKAAYFNLTAATREVAAKKKVALGLFDGACPVADITCPAKKTINDNRKLSATSLETAKAIQDQRQEEYDAVKARLDSLKDLHRKHRDLVTRRDALRKEVASERDEVVAAKKRLKEMGELRDPVDVRVEAALLEEQITEIKVKLNAAQTRNTAIEALDQSITDITQKIEALAKLAAVATQARTIFRVTQRRIAERAITSISNRANDMLRTVDLNFEIQWEREGRDPAKSCEMCGMAFPASAKVKECQVCGAARGNHVVQKLEFLLSDRSGAADDWAGIALQLSAGSWLLDNRQSQWATAMIDEPFAQMDRTVRRDAAKQMLNLVGMSAFRQIFVISHADDTVSMYGGRVTITVKKNGERTIEVL